MLAGRGDGADGRRAEQRMAGRRRECREPNADAWLLVRVRVAGSRTNGRQDPLGAVRHAERKLEIQLICFFVLDASSISQIVLLRQMRHCLLN